MSVGWAVAIVVLWLAVVTLAVVLLGVLRQVTSALDRLARQPATPMQASGPAVGSTLPDFTAHDAHGEMVDAAQLREQSSVLLFLSPGCGPCRTLAEELTRSDPAQLAGFLTVVTEPGGVDELQLPAWLRVAVLPEDTQVELFGIPGRPFVIAADQDWSVRGTQLLNTVGQITDFAAAKLSSELAYANGVE